MDKDYYNAVFLYMFKLDYLKSKLTKVQAQAEIQVQAASQVLEKAQKERAEASRQVNMYPKDDQKKDDLELAKKREVAAQVAYDVAQESLEIQRPNDADDKHLVSGNSNA